MLAAQPRAAAAVSTQIFMQQILLLSTGTSPGTLAGNPCAAALPARPREIPRSACFRVPAMVVSPRADQAHGHVISSAIYPSSKNGTELLTAGEDTP